MPTLLIIDDKEKLRALLARILGLEGYRVIQAALATLALKLIERDIPDVILSDVRLPDMGGLPLRKKIKALNPDTEAILLTAFRTIGDRVQAIKMGFRLLNKSRRQ